jgi:hypothetical protein
MRSKLELMRREMNLRNLRQQPTTTKGAKMSLVAVLVVVGSRAHTILKVKAALNGGRLIYRPFRKR